MIVPTKIEGQGCVCGLGLNSTMSADKFIIIVLTVNVLCAFASNLLIFF